MAGYAEHRHQFKTYAAENVKVLPPVKREGQNIICIGKNYADHAAEMGEKDAPEAPLVFTKASSSLIADGEDIELDEAFTKALDYEGEIAVVIGKAGRRISKEQAMEHVFGYTLSMMLRPGCTKATSAVFFLQKRGHVRTDWAICYCRSFRSVLGMETRNVCKQREKTVRKHIGLIFGIAELIEQLSSGMTLRPATSLRQGRRQGSGQVYSS
ncbi:fumarylacetoacetate hydrolase family protein [Marinococcus halophilus]